MNGGTAEPRDDGALLAATLRKLRRRRGLSKIEVAAGMNMPLRTYNRFEAGETRLNLDYIHRFAQVTRSDPQAILMAVAIGSPDFAARACDNQLATILTVALRNFDADVGDGIAGLDSRTVIGAVTRLFDDLAARARDPDAASTWLERGVDDLKSRRPRPGR